MSSKRGPRVLIATLFLPETPSFDETPLQSPTIPLLSASAEPSRSASAPSAAHVDSDGSNSVPFPTSTSSRFGPGGLSPITSGRATPQPGQGLLGTPPRSNSGSDAEGDSKPSRTLLGSGLNLTALPSIASAQRDVEGGASSQPRVKPPLTRNVSIVEDLQARNSGSLGAATPKLTPSDLELGVNPFEANVASPAAVTPSLQSSIASKRPAINRLTSEGNNSPGLNALTATLKERLERLHGANNAAKTPGSILDPANPGRLGRPGTIHEDKNEGALISGSYFASTAAAPGSITASIPRTRRRSSSASRSSTSMSGGAPGLSRAFSRNKKTDHRKRASSSAEATLAGSITSLPDIPPFHFEGNAHANGGLLNAVRSVADVHVRTSSEPVPQSFSSEKTSTVRASGVPGLKSAVGEYMWIGTPGCGIADFDDSLRRVMDKRYRDEKRSAVVWVEDDVLEPAYDKFCKQNLWPTFHYQIHDAHKTKAFESPAWKDYLALNQAFADKIVENYAEGDLIWVNDYHLLLVPQMVRAKLPGATIGFFLHIAFPSSEIFRCLSVRKELLQGVLGADLIGFQTYNTARHFRQTCQRLLSVEATPKGIQLEGGFAKVGVFPIGIDVKALHERKKEAEVESWVETLRERYAGQKVLIARDKLDEIKGVRQKLLAFEAFLERYPEWQGKVVLVQVAMATSAENEKQGEVMDVVSRINARFSNFTYQPVVFLHQDVSFSQYLALLTIADAFINASLREGMNLTSHEYIICQTGSWGPLILSEFTGSYSRAGFQRCIPINPYDKLQCARAINEALTMPEDEKISRWRDLERHVWSQTAQHWCTGFLHALRREVVDVKTRPLQSPDPNSNEGLPPLFQAEEAVSAYNTSKKRLLLLDLEGTLCPDDPHSSRKKKLGKSADAAVKLDESVTDALLGLARNKKNTIYVMSGRSYDDLQQLAQDFPALGFVAENGCFVAFPVTEAQKSSNRRQWHKLVTATHQSWRQPVLEILQYYTERTPGSYVDDRGVSIVWRYANTEGHGSEGMLASKGKHMKSGSGGQSSDELPQYEQGVGNEAYHWARRQAAEVQNHIMDSLGERFGLQLYPGATSFIILPRKAGRAIAVARVLQSDEFAGAQTDEQDAKAIELEAEGDDAEAEADRLEQRKEDTVQSTGEALFNQNEQESQKAFTKEVNKAEASRKLLESYDYVLSMGEDQRLCSWLEDMALEQIVTLSVGDKRRNARWRLPGPKEVGEALQVFATKGQ